MNCPATGRTVVSSPSSQRQRMTDYLSDPAFPCVGAKSALNKDRMWFEPYAELGDPADVRALCNRLKEFSDAFPEPGVAPVSFVAMYGDDFADEKSTIGEDRVGRHDFLLTPCSQEMFEILYRHQGHHPSCFENLHRLLAQFGIRPEQIGTTFNVFMNVRVDPAGTVSVEPPHSRAGDFVELRAEMDLVCALTSCSAEQSNNGSFKPIDFEIVTPAP